MKNIEKIIKEVADISKENAEKVQNLVEAGEFFNMFQVCGVGHEELKHSAIIAEFLNPQGSHGQKHKFLECFIKTLENDEAIKDFNFICEKATVSTEEPITSGRLDIFIIDKNNHALIFENKRPTEDYDDGWEQLKKYDEYAKSKYKDYRIFYLTLNGEKASEQSAKNVNYIPISYKETIIYWLQKCLDIVETLPMVRETIKQYINHLTNQQMDIVHKNRIIEILSRPENLRATRDIYQIESTEVFSSLAEKFFFPKLEEYAKQKGLVFEAGDCGETYLAFTLYHPKWQNEYKIYFDDEGDSKNLTHGIIKLEKAVSKKSKSIRDALSDYKTNKGWLAYKLYEISLDTWLYDIVEEKGVFFNDCKKIIEELLQAIDGV